MAVPKLNLASLGVTHASGASYQQGATMPYAPAPARSPVSQLSSPCKPPSHRPSPRRTAPLVLSDGPVVRALHQSSPRAPPFAVTRDSDRSAMSAPRPTITIPRNLTGGPLQPPPPPRTRPKSAAASRIPAPPISGVRFDRVLSVHYRNMQSAKASIDMTAPAAMALSPMSRMRTLAHSNEDATSRASSTRSLASSVAGRAESGMLAATQGVGGLDATELSPAQRTQRVRDWGMQTGRFNVEMTSADDNVRGVSSNKATRRFVAKVHKFDELEADIQAAVRDKARLKTMWSQLDSNGNGLVSLAELDRWVLWKMPLLNNKAALQRAFVHTTSKRGGGDGDDWVERHEFKQLLVSLFYFNKLWALFADTDTDGDHRISLDEFRAVLPLLDWPCDTHDEAAIRREFAAIDTDGGGLVLFGEFCSHVARRQCQAAFAGITEDEVEASADCVNETPFESPHMNAAAHDEHWAGGELLTAVLADAVATGVCTNRALRGLFQKHLEAHNADLEDGGKEVALMIGPPKAAALWKDICRKLGVADDAESEST